MLLPAIQQVPNEVIISIAAEIDSPHDLSAFSRTSHHFHHILDGFLYLQSALRWNNSALFWAVKSGQLAIARRALRARGDINAREPPLRDSQSRPRRLRCYSKSCDHSKATPVLLAVEAGHYEMVKHLLTIEGRDIRSKNKCGFHPLEGAALLGDAALVELFLQADDVTPELGGHELMTPLMAASSKGHVEIVKTLLAHPGVNPCTGNWYSKTPIFQASMSGHAEIVKLLLDAGASPSRQYDEFPLELAAGRGHTEVVRHLLNAGADVEFFSNLATLFYNAAREKHIDLFKMFKERLEDSDLNAHGGSGQTALWWAARHGHEEMVSILLACDGIDVNARHIDGIPKERLIHFSNSEFPELGSPTVLIVAAIQGHSNVVKMLLSTDGIDLDAVNTMGATAMDVADENGHRETAELIRAARKAKGYQEGEIL